MTGFHDPRNVGVAVPKASYRLGHLQRHLEALWHKVARSSSRRIKPLSPSLDSCGWNDWDYAPVFRLTMVPEDHGEDKDDDHPRDNADDDAR